MHASSAFTQLCLYLKHAASPELPPAWASETGRKCWRKALPARSLTDIFTPRLEPVSHEPLSFVYLSDIGWSQVGDATLSRGPPCTWQTPSSVTWDRPAGAGAQPTNTDPTITTEHGMSAHSPPPQGIGEIQLRTKSQDERRLKSIKTRAAGHGCQPQQEEWTALTRG